MINIGIVNAADTLNYGSMMLCENTLTYLSRMIADSHFIVVAKNPEMSENRLKAATGLQNIEAFGRIAGSRARPRPLTGLSRQFDQISFARRCHAIIVLGGDDISEYYSLKNLVKNLLGCVRHKALCGKLFFVGQTIGPFKSWRLPLAKMVLSGADKIYHRGCYSLRYAVDDMGLGKNSVLGADLAFLDLARQGEVTERINQIVSSAPYMTFVPSGLWNQYSSTHDEYMIGLTKIVDHFTDYCKARHMRLVLLPHVWHDRDIKLAEALNERMSPSHVCAVSELLLPFEAREILGAAVFNVSQRMHGAISSLQKGVPALSLSYSVKYNDVIGGQLGLQDLIVEMPKTAFLQTVSTVCHRIDETLGELESFKSRVSRGVEHVKASALAQLEEIAVAIAR